MRHSIFSHLERRSPGGRGSFKVNMARVLFILSPEGLKEAECHTSGCEWTPDEGEGNLY